MVDRHIFALFTSSTIDDTAVTTRTSNLILIYMESSESQLSEKYKVIEKIFTKNSFFTFFTAWFVLIISEGTTTHLGSADGSTCVPFVNCHVKLIKKQSEETPLDLWPQKIYTLLQVVK